MQVLSEVALNKPKLLVLWILDAKRCMHLKNLSHWESYCKLRRSQNRQYHQIQSRDISLMSRTREVHLSSRKRLSSNLRVSIAKTVRLYHLSNLHQCRSTRQTCQALVSHQDAQWRHILSQATLEQVIRTSLRSKLSLPTSVTTQSLKARSLWLKA